MLSKITAFITTALLAVFTAHAQIPQTDKPFIQVQGSAEKEVVPDEIYISINLVERYEGRTKVTIDEQEKQLKDMVKAMGVDLSNLSVSNADASYIRVNWFNKDVMARKGYMLKLTNAELVADAFRRLSDINIKDASVSRADYSKKEELKKELRIEAVRKAKDQAGYMLEAIGQIAGKPLYIAENGNFYYPMMNANRMMMMDKAQVVSAAAPADDYLEFKKIKFTTNVEARFEIK